MKVLNLIKSKAAIAAVGIGTALGAFLMPVSAFASDGNGAVYMELPDGWQNHEYTGMVKVEDYVIWDKENKETTITAAEVDYAFDNDKYKNITDTMQVTIDHNCKLKLRVIYTDGCCAYAEYDIKNFDLERPIIEAALEGENMYLTAADEISGVSKITVNGQDYTDLKDNQMCTCIKDYEQTDEYIEISSTDKAGNVSKGFKIKNPYFVGEIQSGQEDKSLDNPDSVEATDPTKARGTVTDDFTTNEREFFTVDASGKTFYLIVDRSQSSENVYLLTEAGCNDLLNFTDYNGVDVQNGDVPMYEILSNGTAKKSEAAEASDETTKDSEDETKETEETKTSSSSWLVIVLVAAVFGGGYYFLKVRKNKEDLLDAGEMDEFDNGGEIAVDDSEYEDDFDGDEETDMDDSENGGEDCDKEDAYDEGSYDEDEKAGADISPEDLAEDETNIEGLNGINGLGEFDEVEYVDLGDSDESDGL